MQIYGPEDTIRAGASAKRAYLGWFSQAVVGRAAIPSFLPPQQKQTEAIPLKPLQKFTIPYIPLKINRALEQSTVASFHACNRELPNKWRLH